MAENSVRPDAHTQKYDRQLRLWAATGQRALETTSILVVNATATAASTLKNLVLPGIGQFALLDPKIVDSSDIGNNFFLQQSSLGKPRAQEVTRLLLELNSDVKGTALVQDIDSMIREPQLLASYTLIIAVDTTPSETLSLSQIAWQSGIPFVQVKTCGFFALLRAQYPEITLVETHPESLVDLRLSAPFPELVDFAASFDYSTMDSNAHGHVPAVVVILKALDAWKASHAQSLPTTLKERNEFMSTITRGKRSPDDENFDEALSLYRRAGSKPPVPSEIVALFNDPSSEVNASSTNFWLLVNALKQFVNHPSIGGLLPLSGALPDMKAESTGYVALQKVYKSKARSDIDLFTSLLQSTMASVGADLTRISAEEIETFTKHAAYLKVMRGRSIVQEQQECLLAGKLAELYEASSWNSVRDDTVDIYLGFRASDIFYEKNKRYPGTLSTDGDGEHDVPELAAIVEQLVVSLGESSAREELLDVVKEICRSGASDLPQIAALVGGIVGQEVIKLITSQYIPLNGTCIFNGITSTSGIVVG